MIKGQKILPMTRLHQTFHSLVTNIVLKQLILTGFVSFTPDQFSSMQKISFALIFLIAATSCNKSSELDEMVTKETVLSAIDSYKNSVIKLGALPNSSSVVRTGTSANSLITKDKLISSSQYDQEWLEMFLNVLTFSEELIQSDYELGEERTYFDVLDDAELWPWPVNNETIVSLDYRRDVLQLRVVSEALAETFLFQYAADDQIKILRVVEEIDIYGDGNPHLYVEDFLEGTGLNMWRSEVDELQGRELLISKVILSNGWTHTIKRIQDSGSFENAFGLIDGIPAIISPDRERWIMTVEYDFKDVDVFDSFNEAGELFMNGSMVEMPLTMKVMKYLRQGTEVYRLTGVKDLQENPPTTLSVPEANINTDLTFEDYLNDQSKAFQHPTCKGISYDYSKGRNSVFKQMSDLLYFEY